MATVSTILGTEDAVNVPDDVRKLLGLKEGDPVDVVVRNGQTIYRPAGAPPSPFEDYIGAFPAFESVEEVNAWIREMRADEEGGLSSF